MNNIVITCLLFCFLLSCSNDDSDSKIVGTWQLTTRTVGVTFDVNNDNTYNDNLLEVVDCNDSEILTFSADGTVSSGNEFPKDIIYFKYNNSDYYGLQVECNQDGLISFASEYKEVAADTIMILNQNYYIDADTLTTVYDNAITIYSEDLTSVIETRDLTLIYTKK
ncbi:hypothetical protein [Winogradskyella vidalii]|uniref:hypothetical protein n=1 Tax=Winogradskyella vidalii TaxID=2615024 RepID=UPI0015C8A2E7|nr:hypothetical protein [Winogradskyella vidalii]